MYAIYIPEDAYISDPYFIIEEVFQKCSFTLEKDFARFFFLSKWYSNEPFTF
jgi:hypothetical protein